MPFTCTRVFLRINNSTDVTLEIYPNTSAAEVRSLFHSAADIAEGDRDVLLKLAKKDGTIISVGPNIPENDAGNPYFLTTKSSSSAVKESPATAGIAKTSQIEAKLADIAQSLSTFRDLDGLKEQIQQFQNKITDVEKLVTRSAFQNHQSGNASCKIKRLTKLEPRFATQPKYVFTEETTEYLKHPSFNNWQWEENEMASLLEHMFFELGVVDAFKIDLPNLKRFLRCVKDNYNMNPFHNFRHCFCVTQMMYGMLHVTGLADKLSHRDKLILLISTICHDLDHPGTNNSYQINARTELAILYNDHSPLENHHCAMTFVMLQEPDLNILCNLSETEFTEVRKGVIRCILGTDMAQHGSLMSNFKTHVDDFDYDNREHVDLLLVMLMKCADISNEARPADVADPWVDCLLEEFFSQSDREKAEGLPVAPFMDREKVTKPGAQIGFIGFVLIPLFELVSKLLPDINNNILPTIKKAHQYYKGLAEEQASAKN